MASTTYFPMVGYNILYSTISQYDCHNVKDSYKTFVSPDDYHRKVVQKLREFNEAVDQVT